MRKPPTSYHKMNTKANHDTNSVNNGLLYVIRFFEGDLGQNVYSMGTIHCRKCTHCRLEITSTMPRCFLVRSTMSRHIEKSETRNKNRSFHMKRKQNCSLKRQKTSLISFGQKKSHSKYYPQQHHAATGIQGHRASPAGSGAVPSFTNTGAVGTRPEQPPGTAHPHREPTPSPTGSPQPQTPPGASPHRHQPAAS